LFSEKLTRTDDKDTSTTTRHTALSNVSELTNESNHVNRYNCGNTDDVFEGKLNTDIKYYIFSSMILTLPLFCYFLRSYS